MDVSNQKEEVVDIVDEKDNIIGEALRIETNVNPKLIHREVAIILHDGDKLLIQKRSKTKKVHPGMWGFTAGHIEKGQTPLEAAHRELFEELGFDTDLEFLVKEYDQIPTESRFVYWYVGSIPKDVEIKIDPEEVEKIKILSQKEFMDLINSGEKVTSGLATHSEKFWSQKK